jgi:hypothetical protein
MYSLSTQSGRSKQDGLNEAKPILPGRHRPATDWDGVTRRVKELEQVQYIDVIADKAGRYQVIMQPTQQEGGIE